MASLIFAIASSAGSTPEMAKKQVWRTVLVRPARPTSRAIRPASMAYSWTRLARIFSCTGRRMAEHINAVQQAELVAADEAGLPDEVGRLDGRRAEAQV